MGAVARWPCSLQTEIQTKRRSNTQRVSHQTNNDTKGRRRPIAALNIFQHHRSSPEVMVLDVVDRALDEIADALHRETAVFRHIWMRSKSVYSPSMGVLER